VGLPHWYSGSGAAICLAATFFCRELRARLLATEERKAARRRVKAAISEAVLDHHVFPAVIEGALKRIGFTKTLRLLSERLPREPRTRTGNFGEVLASEHLRQRYGYQMPVFKLRFMDHPNMPMRGEDLVAFRLKGKRVIAGLCVGEAKTMQAFRSQEVQDAHDRLKQAYHPHPVSLAMISSILHTQGSPLAEEVDKVLETLSVRSFPRDNWIFLVTGNAPTDPFSVVEAADDVIENLTCVNLCLGDLEVLIQDVFDRPLRRRAPAK
jgi:hypothetical protein